MCVLCWSELYRKCVPRTTSLDLQSVFDTLIVAPRARSCAACPSECASATGQHGVAAWSKQGSIERCDRALVLRNSARQRITRSARRSRYLERLYSNRVWRGIEARNARCYSKSTIVLENRRKAYSPSPRRRHARAAKSIGRWYAHF